MTVYDSSVLIDYLNGDARTVEYVEEHIDERPLAPPLVWFEVYQGEVFKSGEAEFDAVDSALGWVSVAETERRSARIAAELQNELYEAGDVLAPRDAFVAGVARSFGGPLAVSDDDFDTEGIGDLLDIDFVR